jgi:hypothetical protein
MITKSIQELETTSIAKENRLVQIPFSQAEKEQKQDDYLQNNIKLAAIQEEFLTIRESFKLKIKEVSEVVKKNFFDLRNGYEETNEECYLVDNQEDGTMEFYSTGSGNLVYSRPLRPDERQTNLLSLKKVGK